MSFLLFFEKHISFHRFWCIHQTHHSTSSGRLKLWLKIGPILHLLLMAVILTLCFIYEKKVFTQGSTLSKAVDVIQLVFPVCIHIIIITEGYFKRRYDYGTARIVADVEVELEKDEIQLTSVNRQFKRKYYFLSLLVQVISIFVEFYIIATITASPDWVRHWLAKVFSFAYTRLAIFNYVFIVDYISSRLSVINSQLVNLKDYSLQINLSSTYDPVLYKKLLLTKKLHQQLWKLSDLHNRRHSVFILGSMTSFFICLTIDFYWMYANLYYGDNIFISRKFAWSFYFIF